MSESEEKVIEINSNSDDTPLSERKHVINLFVKVSLYCLFINDGWKIFGFLADSFVKLTRVLPTKLFAVYIERSTCFALVWFFFCCL